MRLKTVFVVATINIVCLSLTAPVGASILEFFDYGGVKINDVRFHDREVILRLDPNGDLNLPGGTYKKVLGTVDDPVAVGDIFVQILEADYLSIEGNKVWWHGGQDMFQAYGAQVIEQIDYTAPGQLKLTFGPVTTDPFGILDVNKKEMFALYVDTGPGATVLNEMGTLQDGVNSVTDGVKWATFGATVYASDKDQGGAQGLGYAYSYVLPIFQTGFAYYGLNVIYCSQPGLIFPGVRDDQYATTPPGTLTSAYGRAYFSPNLTQGSPWTYYSKDPFDFRAVPEPASILVWAGLFLATATFTIRRRQAGDV